MGENFLRKQAQGYRVRENAAYAEIVRPTLIAASRKVEYKAAYICQPVGAPPAVGTKVWLNVSDGAGTIYEGATIVGALDPAEGAALAKALGEDFEGIAKATVDSETPLGDFTITCDVEGDPDGDE